MVAVHRTYNESLQQYADEYFQETHKDSATTKEIALWLIQTGRWEAPSGLLVRICREDVARALRDQYISDNKGRPVRAKHVSRIIQGGQQLHLWADIRTAPREFMESAFQQRREQIVCDCRQLKRDADYFNASHPEEPRIQLVFDFTDDLTEGDFPAQYPPRQPR